MEKENKKLKILIAILLIVLMTFGGYYIYEKVDNNGKNVNEKTKDNESTSEKNKENEYTKEELLTLLDGIWYSCRENSLGYMICTIRQFHNNNFNGGQYGTGGGYGGEIKSVSLIENNTYVFVTYSAGCHGNDCMVEKEEKYETFIVDITNILNGTITIDGVEVKYAAKDTESAYKIIDNILYS